MSENKDADGQSLTIIPGRHGEPDPETPNIVPDDGDIIFKLASGAECLVFKGDGRVFVRGELCDDNPAIYRAFKDWMNLSIRVVGTEKNSDL